MADRKNLESRPEENPKAGSVGENPATGSEEDNPAAGTEDSPKQGGVGQKALAYIKSITSK